MILGDKLKAFHGFLEDLDQLNRGLLPYHGEEAVRRAIGWYEDAEFQEYFRDKLGETRELLETMVADDPKRQGVSDYLRKLYQFRDTMNLVAKKHKDAIIYVKNTKGKSHGSILLPNS